MTQPSLLQALSKQLHDKCRLRTSSFQLVVYHCEQQERTQSYINEHFRKSFLVFSDLLFLTNQTNHGFKHLSLK